MMLSTMGNDIIKDTSSIPSIDTLFFGESIEGRRLLFIIDRSSSMQGERYQLLLKEVDKMIDFLDSKAQNSSEKITLSFITFNEMRDMFPSKDPINMKLKNAGSYAKRGVRFYLEPRGRTNFIHAWEEALKRIPKQNIDEVYFLTDGEARSPLSMIKDWQKRKRNEKFKFKLKCISIGTESEVLQKMANELPNTTYRVVKSPPKDEKN